MSEYAEAHNLISNPKPISAAAWANGGGRSITRSVTDDGWLQMVNDKNQADSFVYTRLSLPAGAWRFGVEMDAATTGYADNQLRFIHLNPVYEMRRAEWDGTAGRIVTPPNVLDSDSQVELRLMVGPSQGDTVRIRRLFITTQENWELMRTTDIIWFDGDGYLPGGGLPPRNHYPHVDHCPLVVVA